jgi:hypothetical protein
MDRSFDESEAILRDRICLPLVVEAMETPTGKNFHKTDIGTLPAGPAARPGQQIRL